MHSLHVCTIDLGYIHVCPTCPTVLMLSGIKGQKVTRHPISEADPVFSQKQLRFKLTVRL